MGDPARATAASTLLGGTPFAEAVLETIGNLVVVTDRGGGIELFNAACERLTGYRREEVLGRHVADVFFLPEDRDRIAAAHDRVVRGKFPFGGEHYYWLTKTGQRPLVSWRYTALTDADGKVEYVIGTGEDITEARQVETERNESLDLLEAILDSSQDAILVLDHRGCLVEWNAAAQRMFGYERSDTVGRGMSDVIIPERLRGSYRAGLGVLQKGGTLHALGRRVETLGVRRDGQEFPIELALSAWNSGEDLKIVAVIRDLSDRAEAESARLASEAKSRFLALMSHEFRTPLNSILGFAQLLGDGSTPLDGRQSRYVGHILTSGQHLLDLINDLLDLSKVQSGQMNLQVVSVDLGVALDETATKLRPLAAAAEVELILEPCRGLRLRADRRRFDQVMLNLIANAIKFTPPGGSIQVRTRRAGKQVEVSVTDTGIGIPLEEQERIFDEFTQVDSERSRDQAGSGLGLALTQQLVNVMDGTVRVSSILGRGSTFTVALPVA